MLFYVQMKWNYQGRISQDQLWDLESIEGDHALAGLKSGMVKALYKVASQHRVIAIVDVDSAENLDRNSMGWLPLREYLEFEQVWALRDYPGFIQDVKAKFPFPSEATKSDLSAVPQRSTQEVAEQWFAHLSQGLFEEAMKLVSADVVWRNIPPTPGISDVAPWLGSYQGIDAVRKSFDVWAAHSKMLVMEVQEMVVQGDTAIAVVHEHAQCLANRSEYDLYVATHLGVSGGKIVSWQVYWDPSPLIKAYKSS